MKPPKRQRPLIAIIGVNDATEATDYLMPYGILRRADAADVLALATEPGPVTLFPALKVEPQATVAEFDARHPEGADYVIVPAMSRDDDPAVLQWLKSQAAKDAIIIGVCAGAKVRGVATSSQGSGALSLQPPPRSPLRLPMRVPDFEARISPPVKREDPLRCAGIRVVVQTL